MEQTAIQAIDNPRRTPLGGFQADDQDVAAREASVGLLLQSDRPENGGVERSARSRVERQGVSGEDRAVHSPVAEEAAKRTMPKGDIARSTTQSLSTLEYDPVHVGCATLISILPDREAKSLHVDSSSVYGAFVALPQLARTANWPSSMSRLVHRTVVFLILNVVVQATILAYISKDHMIMDKFAGKVNLCDFGAKVNSCPADEHGRGVGGDDCIGPGGTKFTPSRMYSFDTWTTRLYTKQAFKDIFPDKASEIESHVDAGEYGLESWNCRVLCIFMLMLAMMKDLTGTIDLCRLLYHIPSTGEPWIRYRHPDWAPDKEYAKEIHDCEDLDFVSIKIAGMPRHWKIINIVFVVIPKALLYKMTAENGTNFLMETSTIDDMIINSMALSFILNIDELIFDCLLPDTAKALLNRLSHYPLYDEAREAQLTHEDALMRLHKECNESFLRQMFAVIPGRLFAVMSLTAWFIINYYWAHCEYKGDWHWISKDMYLPRSTVMSFASVVFPRLFHIEHEDEPYWTFEPQR